MQLRLLVTQRRSSVQRAPPLKSENGSYAKPHFYSTIRLAGAWDAWALAIAVEATSFLLEGSFVKVKCGFRARNAGFSYQSPCKHLRASRFIAHLGG